MAYTLQQDGFYHIPIVDFGTRLRDHFGLDVGEHSAFGSVGKHAPNSYHYYGEAIDVRDWRPDVIDGVDWRTRTGNLQSLLKGVGPEVIGPNSGDPGHSTHLHLAAKGGVFKLTPQQYATFYGGGIGGKNATFASHSTVTPPPSSAGTAVSPGGTSTVVPEADPNGPKPITLDTSAQAEALERTRNYAKLQLAEMIAGRGGGSLQSPQMPSIPVQNDPSQWTKYLDSPSTDQGVRRGILTKPKFV